MKIIKGMFKNIGYVVFGALSIVLLIGMVFWEMFKFVGRIMAWVIDMKIQEKYHPKDKEV